MGDAMGGITTFVTFEEFERLPEDESDGKVELIDGEVVRMPPAFFRHMDITMRTFLFLHGTLDTLHANGLATGLGRVCMETGYHMGNNWLTPDVSITHAGQTVNKYLEGAPALAIEVISESNTVPKMRRKIRKYFENGCRELWVFDPDTASVVVHRGKTSVEVEGQLSTDLLPGITIDLAAIFA
jgi:Uma2 family endonuclease